MFLNNLQSIDFQFCKENDATLAEIRNEFDKAIVRRFVRSIRSVHLIYPADFWIGLTDRESEGIYVWESDKSVSTTITMKDVLTSVGFLRNGMILTAIKIICSLPNLES